MFCRIAGRMRHRVSVRRFHTVMPVLQSRAESGRVDGVLMDQFGRKHDYLRVSLTERCNLRCTYCMPEEGVELKNDREILSNEEVVQLIKCFVSQGVRKVRFTGGEPLIRKGIEDLCQQVKALGVQDIAITTNGILLKRKLDALAESGLNLVNISLDTLVEPKFQLITRRKGFSHVWEAIELAVSHPRIESVKVNCVVKRGVNDDELVDFVSMTRNMNVEVRFIEYMPFEGNKWHSKALLPYFEMVDMIRKEFPEFARMKSLDSENTVSKTWQVPGFTGRVGFISSMSDHFCGTCNRMRLTADGNIKACLFGEEEVSLRDILRSGARDDEIVDVIQNTLSRKHAKLGGHESPESIAEGKNRAMILIGG